MLLKIGVCQLQVEVDKEMNLAKAEVQVREAAAAGATVICLPEMFNCPYRQDWFPRYAELVPQGETTRRLAALAVETQCYLVGGSFPEMVGDRIYNTALVFDPCGTIVAKHRKVHLFDVAIPDKIVFQESAVFSPGNTRTVFPLANLPCGLAICYDLRFPELFRLMADDQAQIIFVPAAFNMTSGPAHWELLFRARAVDNQVFMVGISPARNPDATYQSYGHSIIVNPWGEILWQADAAENTTVTELNLSEIRQVRDGLPLLKQRRLDLYRIQDLQGGPVN